MSKMDNYERVECNTRSHLRNWLTDNHTRTKRIAETVRLAEQNIKADHPK